MVIDSYRLPSFKVKKGVEEIIGFIIFKDRHARAGIKTETDKIDRLILGLRCTL